MKKKYKTPEYIPSNPNAIPISEEKLVEKLDSIFKYNARKIKELTMYSYENIQVYTKYVELIRMLMFFNNAYAQFKEKGTIKDETEEEKLIREFDEKTKVQPLKADKGE